MFDKFDFISANLKEERETSFRISCRRRYRRRCRRRCGRRRCRRHSGSASTPPRPTIPSPHRHRRRRRLHVVVINAGKLKKNISAKRLSIKLRI